VKRAQAMTAEVRRALEASPREWMAMREAVVKCAAKQARLNQDDAPCAADAVREIRDRFEAAFNELAELRELALQAEYEAQLEAAQAEATAQAQVEFYEVAS
jgi:hypothetical protein